METAWRNSTGWAKRASANAETHARIRVTENRE